jgi:hypothetical protein
VVFGHTTAIKSLNITRLRAQSIENKKQLKVRIFTLFFNYCGPNIMILNVLQQPTIPWTTADFLVQISKIKIVIK